VVSAHGRWDGAALTLDVNGQRKRVTPIRTVKGHRQSARDRRGGHLIDNLKIENPKLRRCRCATQGRKHAILLAGRPKS